MQKPNSKLETEFLDLPWHTEASTRLMADTIAITELELSSFIGVPDAERASAQRLTANLAFSIRGTFARLSDDINQTVDYSAVCKSVREMAMSRPRHLIETLATDIAEMILSRFSVAFVEVELRKYVIPDVRHVSVKIFRKRDAD